MMLPRDLLLSIRPPQTFIPMQSILTVNLYYSSKEIFIDKLASFRDCS
jgi:hypothetical protein